MAFGFTNRIPSIISANYRISGRVENSLVGTDIFNHHRNVPTYSFSIGGQDAMLTVVLCRFSVPVGKYFPKITQHYSPLFLDREWLASSHAHAAEILDSVFCYRLDSIAKLIKAMHKRSDYEIALGLETENAVNFFSEGPEFGIISLLGNKVSSRRNRYQLNESQNLLLRRQEALIQVAANVLGGVL